MICAAPWLLEEEYTLSGGEEGSRSLLPLLALLLDGLPACWEALSACEAAEDAWALEAFLVYGFRGRGL